MEDTEAIEAAMGAKHLYEVLGLPLETSTPDIVKRRYYKLALMVHPDKNRHPQVVQLSWARLASLN